MVEVFVMGVYGFVYVCCEEDVNVVCVIDEGVGVVLD